MKPMEKRYKTNKVTNYFDRIFVADISEVKTLDDFKDILYDVFVYGDSVKSMFINSKIYKDNIKKYFQKLGPKNDGKWCTAYGDISVILYVGGEDKLSGRYAKVEHIYNNSDVNIIVSGAGTSSAYIFVPNDIIMNTRTSEVMKVVGIPEPDTITVNRSVDITPVSAYIPATPGIEGDNLCIIETKNKNNDNLLVFVDKNIFN